MFGYDTVLFRGIMQAYNVTYLKDTGFLCSSSLFNLGSKPKLLCPNTFNEAVVTNIEITHDYLMTFWLLHDYLKTFWLYFEYV